MDRATAQVIIEPHRNKIVRAVLQGHADTVGGLDPGYLASLSNRSRFGCIWDRIKFHLMLSYGAIGPVRWAHADDNPQLEFLYIDAEPESAALRPKKADRFDTLTSNYPTEYEKDVRVEQCVLYGVQPHPAHLFVVYTEDGNEIKPDVERILVTNEYRSNGSNHLDWWYELYRADDTIIPFGSGFEQPPLPGTGFKIKPRRPAPEQEKPGRMKPTGSEDKSANKPDAADGGKKSAEGGKG